jgi:uncharacterized protein (AIM24 family)
MPSTRGRDPAVEEEFLGALYKGGELLASGKIVEAREHLEKAHGLEPKNEKAQNLLGLTYFKLGLFDRASEVYEKLVNENPADATLRVNLGLVYLKTNNLERCIKEFETATDLEPTHKKAHNYLGLALAQQGTYAKAKEHFILAGSDQMAEKMGRAIAAQSTPSGLQSAVARQTPKTVVIGEEESPKPPPPPRVEDETIEVMSDEELPSDVYVVPEEEQLPPPLPAPSSPGLNSDWGAQLKPPPPEDSGEMRFAEDEGPPEAALIPATVEELPVLEADVEVMPPDAEPAPATTPTAPAWLTMEAAEASRPTPAPTAWVTETVADVPLHSGHTPLPQPQPEAGLGATDPRWDTATVPSEALSTANDAWAQESAPAEVAPVTDDASWAESPPVEIAPLEAPPVADDASWATGAAVEAAPLEAAPVADDASWATGAPVEAAPLEAAPVADDASWATGAPVEAAPVADDASWAAGAPVEAAPVADDASWATGTQAPVEQSWSTETQAPVADEASWAASTAAPAPASDDAAWTEPAETTPGPADDASWATGPQTEAPVAQPTDDAAWATGAQTVAPLPTTEDDSSWATGTPEPEAPIMAAAPEPALEPPAPEPSAPLPITVEEPIESAPAPAPAAPPAGYAPMSPQRLVDLGASGSWVHEPSAGPFHISADGLAVTVAGEMLVRMVGLVAIVGSVQVTPENRRRRGRPSGEPFGTGTSQLQRVSGHGVLYLEPGRSKFHAVDLTDQNGVSIDDDGAYLREELVFAFEEPISFENGKLTAEGQSLELAHLKGNGRILLQLDGSLRAMPIPLGAPMVVPLHRVVGWFGRVTPRLMGFGGRGAVELTGEGYALLGTPAERP